MPALRKIYLSLFLLGWFFFPFNDFEGYKELGEFKHEAGAYFFFAGFVFLAIDCIRRRKILVPLRSGVFQVLLVFIGWCLVTVLLNYHAVSESFFKHTTGVMRFIRQYVSLLLSTIVFMLFFWNCIQWWTVREILMKIRKVLLYCMVFAFVYGFLETLIVYFHVGMLRPVLQLFDYFPFLDVNYQGDGRISSIGYEAPALGNYLIAVSGWMFSYIFTDKTKWKFAPTLMVLFLMYFSGSRTAMINISLQLMILMVVMFSMPQYRGTVKIALRYMAVIAFVALLFSGKQIAQSVDKKLSTLDFSQNLKKNPSNQSRFGMQYASIQVFKEHPIVGVGFGQEGYYTRFHYPGWAKKGNYEFKAFYLNKNFRSFPTAYNLYTRLLSETGIIGLLIWGYLIYLCISGSVYLFRRTSGEEKVLSFIMIVSFAGMSMNWFQTDFFRQYAFWLCFVILIRLQGRRIVPKTQAAGTISEAA